MGTYHDRTGRAFYAGLLEALVEVMGTANGYLFHHGPRSAVLALRLGQSYDLSGRELAELFFGALLQDLGMIGLVEEAWENAVPILTPEKREAVELHPIRSATSVAEIPYLEPVARLVEAHHEWWDGNGYPRGLEKEEIPLRARILRLADTVTALTDGRPYRAPLTADEVRKEVKRTSGAEFDPKIVDRFLDLHDQGQVHPFSKGYFHRALLRSTDHVLPDEVSPVSTDQLLEIFGSLVDAKDPYTGGHSRRVAVFASAVAEKLDLPEPTQQLCRSAGYLHDLGKLSVPLRILTKQGTLGLEEQAAVQRHPVVGARVLQSIPSLQHLTRGCRYHHERWDGKGYPEGISGERIPLVAQILAVCDAYDAMTSGRAYRSSRSHGHAMEEIDACSGSQLGPRAVGGFLTLPYDLFRRIKLDDPAGERGPTLPFTERFYRERSGASAPR